MYNTEFAVALLQKGDNIAGLQFLCVYIRKKLKKANPKTHSGKKKKKPRVILSNLGKG